MSIFFGLSGFLMTVNYWNREPRFGIAFAIKKIKKLYPLHIAMMLCMIPIRVYGGVPLRTLIVQLILHMTLVQIWIPVPGLYSSLNGVAWYLSACVFLYFCFPLILVFIKKVQARNRVLFCTAVAFLLAINVSIVAYCVGNPQKDAVLSMQWITYYCPLTRLIDFFIGCNIAALYIKFSKTEHRLLYGSMEIIGVAMILFSVWIYKTQYGILGSEYVRYSLLFIPTTLLLVWLVAINQGFLFKTLSCRYLCLIGDKSPYGFLIHLPVIWYCRLILSHFELLNPVTVTVSSVVLTVAGIIIWTWLEPNLMNKFKKGNHRI